MMDFYYSLLPVTIGLVWVLATAFLIVVWSIWAHEEVTVGQVITNSGNHITLGDMIWITFVAVAGGGIGGIIAGILCPIAFPVLLVILSVNSIKITQMFKKERAQKKKVKL